MAEYVLLDPKGNRNTFNDDKIFVQNANGELIQFTQGTGGAEAVLESLEVTENGTYTPPSGVDGYNSVKVTVPDTPAVLETLEVTENGTYTPSEGVDGFGSVSVNVDPTKVTVYPETELAQSMYDSEYGYVVTLQPTPFTLTLDEKYYVKWDGVEYECIAKDGSAVIPSTVFIGNDAVLGQPNSGEPFVIAIAQEKVAFILCLTDTAPTAHTVSVCHKITGGSSADVRYVTFKSYDGLTEYGKKAVAVGDDCADPIARGIFGTPTRESDVQYHYTFSGWATAINGSVVSDWNKAIMEDKTVYATYSKATRYYTITYYDGDGVTVLKTESLAYGATPNYNPTKGDLVFEGWNPSISTVTGNASYTAVWGERDESITFETASWEQIGEICAAGKAKNCFAIGDKRPIGGSIAGNVVIVGFDHDDLSDGSGKAAMTLALESVDNTTFNIAMSKNQGWKNSALRTAIRNRESYLPTSLRNIIKPVTKIYTTTSKTTYATCTDTLWAFSDKELGFVAAVSTVIVSEEGMMYQYFAEDGGTKRSCGVNYWTRSNQYYNGYWSYISKEGKFMATGEGNSFNLHFGFCI